MNEANKAKHERERALLRQLQDDHGYTFSDVDRADERFVMLVRHVRNRNTGKTSMLLTAGRAMRVMAPDKSWLASEIGKAAKAKDKAKAKAKAKPNSRLARRSK